MSYRKPNLHKPAAKRQKSGYRWPFLGKEQLFIQGHKELIWQKYCGFLDISIDAFMAIQRLLLKEQIELAFESPLGQALMGDRKPANIDEFRRFTPLTQYSDYQDYLESRNAAVLAVKPFLWVQSTPSTGLNRWVPFSLSAITALTDDAITALILSAATRRGEVKLKSGARLILNLPSPAITDTLSQTLSQRLSCRSFSSPEEAEELEYAKRMDQGVRFGLQSGIDYAFSMAETLFEMGEDYSWIFRHTDPWYYWHLPLISRMGKAVIKSKVFKRATLPKDIWKPQGLVCAGTDTELFRERIAHYWGINPLDVYFNTETGFMALQAWNKKGMTFLPSRHFYEFIPEDEIAKSENDEKYRPSTVLYNELQPDKVYEVVVTDFRGGPFLRYRIGDLIKVAASRDEESLINLPQIVIYSRAHGMVEKAARSKQSGLD